MKTKSIAVTTRLSRADHEYLVSEAESNSTNPSDILRTALRKYREAEQLGSLLSSMERRLKLSTLEFMFASLNLKKEEAATVIRQPQVAKHLQGPA